MAGGVKKLAYFAGMLSGHCKIYQVSLEAQVVQGAQCSSQNLQNQTDPRVAHYQNSLLQCEQTGCRACSQATQEGLLQGGVFASADCAGNHGSSLVPDLELKLAPLIQTQGHLQTGRHQASILGKSFAQLMNPWRGRGHPRTRSSAVTQWLMHVLPSLCLSICKLLWCKTLHLCDLP